MKHILSLAAAALLAGTASARPLTPQDLVTLSRVAAPAVSPDGRWLVWQQRETDLDANKGRTDLWRLDLKAARATPAKFASLPGANEGSPAFAKDGTLWFVSDRAGGEGELFHVDMAGGAPVQATSSGMGIGGFRLSPAGDKLLVWADRRPGAPSLEQPMVKKDPNAGSARTYDQLFIRHWDMWGDGTRSQLFVLPVQGGKAVGNGVALAPNLVGDSPSKPFGDEAELAWAPDGRTIYFTLREAGRIESTSTNMDIFAVPADGSAPPTNLTAANQATDSLPVVSPDGRWLAYAAMERPTYEADRLVLHIRDLRTGQDRALTERWDRSVESIAWAPNSGSLYVTSHDVLDDALFRVDLADGKVHRLSGPGTVSAVKPVAGGVVYIKDRLTAPGDLYRMNDRGQEVRLTSVNAAKLAGIDMPVATRFSFKGANGDTIWGQVVQPAGIAAGAKVPVAFLVHGGPQGSFGNGWSYRWNPAVFAGAGFGAVTVDFHGSIGYGQAFTDAINKDWGGKPLTDLKAGLKAATDQFAWLDAGNVCAAGGSYGGFMMNWIAGNWPDRFKCLVTHAGVFDARAMAYETEELWFDEWEHGGPYYEQAREYERWNPVLHVTEWKTPMLVIHGERDFRIPYTQGIAAFTANQRRGVPSRLVIFPDENHWVLKPKNSLQWHREVLGWMRQWTGAK